MSEIFSSTPFILLLVLGSYLAGCKLYRKKHIALFHPLLVAMVLIIALLSLLDIDYDTFCAGSSFISFLLGPSVVALGYALYEQIEQIRGKEIPVLTAVFAGGIVGIVSVIAICRIMGVEENISLIFFHLLSYGIIYGRAVLRLLRRQRSPAMLSQPIR